jgi:hypothetical protein
MSRWRHENKDRAEKLIRHFDAHGYPTDLPWVLEFLCKVKINDGDVNTPNQQHTLDTLWSRYT